MKKLILFLFLSSSLFCWTACDNDVELEAGWKDIPVVFGLIAKSDSVHYIRIQKAFLEPGGNALNIAQNPDSLYYSNLDVSLVELESGETYNLTRIDGEEDGFERGSGVFAQTPNYLYKFLTDDNTTLVGEKIYELRINRGDNKPEITAQAVIVNDLQFTGPIEIAPIKIVHKDFSVRWRSTEEARFFDLQMHIHYKENSQSDPNFFEDRTLIWNIDQNLERTASIEYKYDIAGEDFYRFLGNQVGTEGDGLLRVFSNIDFVVTAGGQELFDYINIGQANTGITSSQVIPTFTNLSEGVGVFSSRIQSSYKGFTLKPESQDSLRNGIHTNQLNFQ